MIQLDHARAEIAEPNHEEHVAAIDADGGAEAPIDHRVSALLLVPMRREQRAVEGPLWGELLFAPDIQAGLVDKGVDLIANGTGTFIEIIVHHVLTEGNHLPDLVVERRHGPLRRHHLAARADDGINLSAFANAQFPASLVRGLVREIGVKNGIFVHALHPVRRLPMPRAELLRHHELARLFIKGRRIRRGEYVQQCGRGGRRFSGRHQQGSDEWTGEFHGVSLLASRSRETPEVARHD